MKTKNKKKKILESWKLRFKRITFYVPLLELDKFYKGTFVTVFTRPVEGTVKVVARYKNLVINYGPTYISFRLLKKGEII